MNSPTHHNFQQELLERLAELVESEPYVDVYELVRGWRAGRMSVETQAFVKRITEMDDRFRNVIQAANYEWPRPHAYDAFVSDYGPNF